jgi:hypothetical protein
MNHSLHVRGVRHHHALAHPTLDWGAAGWAGLAGGGILILLETSLTSLLAKGPTVDAIRPIAAIALGQAVLPASTPFTALVFATAVSVHLMLSLIYARILAAIIDALELSPGRAAASGAAFGVLLYWINFYAFASVFPWFAAVRGGVALFSHVVYGAATAAIYVRLADGGHFFGGQKSRG